MLLTSRCKRHEKALPHLLSAPRLLSSFPDEHGGKDAAEETTGNDGTCAPSWPLKPIEFQVRSRRQPKDLTCLVPTS
jgi:hypothetical protein